MDEAYDSPDSDGHASIPSANVTMDIHTPPRRHGSRRRPNAPPIESSSEDEKATPLAVPRRRPNHKTVEMQGPPKSRALPPKGRASGLPIRVPSSTYPSTTSSEEDASSSSVQSSRRPSEEGPSQEDVTPLSDLATENKGFVGQSTMANESESVLLSSHMKHMLPNNIADATETSGQTTPDARTGLSKHIGMRKFRNSPPKYDQAQQSSPPPQLSSPPPHPSSPPAGSSPPGSPQLADSVEYSASEDEDDEGELPLNPPQVSANDPSSHEWMEHPQSTRESEGDYTLPANNHPNVNFTDDDIGVMHQRFGQASSVRPSRNFSGLTDRTLENETFEEIDPSFIMERMSMMETDEGAAVGESSRIEELNDQDPEDDVGSSKVTDHGSSELSDEVSSVADERRVNKAESGHASSIGSEDETPSIESDSRDGSVVAEACEQDKSESRGASPAHSPRSPSSSPPPRTVPYSQPKPQSPQPQSPAHSPPQPPQSPTSTNSTSSSSSSPRESAEMLKRRSPQTIPHPSEAPQQHTSPRDPLKELQTGSSVNTTRELEDAQGNEIPPSEDDVGESSGILPHPGKKFNLWEFKNSGLARRVSINTPSTQSSRYTTDTEFLGRNPPSMLNASDYQFDLDPVGKQQQPRPELQPWERLDGSTLEISSPPPLPLQKSIGRKPGSAPPPNSAFSSPTKPQLMQRQRSLSDPLDNILGPNEQSESNDEKPLFAPSRLHQQLASPDMSEDDKVSPPFSSESATSKSTVRPVVGKQLSGHKSPAGQDSQIFSHSTDEQHMSSLRLGDIQVRAETPSSIGNDTKDSSQQSYTPETVRRASSPLHHQNAPLPSLISSPAPSTNGQQTDLQARVQQLENYIQNQNSDMGSLIADYEHRFSQSSEESEHLRETVEALQKHIKALESRKQRAESPEFKEKAARKEKELYAKIRSLEEQILEDREAARAQLKTKDENINLLKEALEGQEEAAEYEDQIEELKQEKAELYSMYKADVEAKEAKYKSILGERDAEIGHLQGELDEMANLLPVDQSSRLQALEDGDEPWTPAQRDRELSIMYEESMDNILSEFRGQDNDDDADDAAEAAEAAEMSLRKIAERAGCKDMDRTQLAAFGIRHVRNENDALRQLIAEGEDKMDHLSKFNEDLEESVKQLRSTIDQLKEEKSAADATIVEKQTSITTLRTEIESVRNELSRKQKDTKLLSTSQDKLRVAEERIKALESESNAQKEGRAKLVEALKAAKAKIDEQTKHIKDRDEEVIRLRQEMNTQTERAYSAENDVLHLQQRIDELNSTINSHASDISSYENNMKALESSMKSLESELFSRTAELDRTKRDHETALQELQTVESSRKKVEYDLAEEATAITHLKAEKSKLAEAIRKLALERKATRAQIETLTRESAEQERAWRSAESNLREQLENKEDILPYERALFRISGEFQRASAKTPEYHLLVEELTSTATAKPELVARVLEGIRGLVEEKEKFRAQTVPLQEKIARLKAAIIEWRGANSKGKTAVGELEKQIMQLRKENKELELRWQVEQKQSDEKIGNLILALRR